MTKASRVGWVLAVGLFFSAANAHAYVTYNRLGYVSCNACHFSPTGGGLLTPYGQSIEASMAVISREKEPSEKVYSQGVQARVLETDSNARANPFLMQADYLATAFINRSPILRADFIGGANLQRGSHGQFAKAPSGWDAFVVRRALLTYEWSPTSQIEFGRDFTVPGLNLDDHTSLLKSRNKRSILDYPTQLRYVYQDEHLQLMPYLAAPSYEESDSNREYGGGVRGEYALNDRNAVGATAFFGNTSALSRLQLGTYFRGSLDHWNGCVAELLWTRRSVHDSSDSFGQESLYLKPYIAVPEWAELGWVYEYLHVAEPYSENSAKFGPSANLRIHEWVSILGDGRNSRTGTQAKWSWYGQVFLHFQI